MEAHMLCPYRSLNEYEWTVYLLSKTLMRDHYFYMGNMNVNKEIYAAHH